MNKFMNGLCLGIWIFQFIFGIVAACGKATINPIVFICATAVCILCYLEKLLD